MNRRTKETDEEIKDIIRAAYMEESIEGPWGVRNWWSTHPYHIKIGIFGLSNVEITVILIP